MNIIKELLDYKTPIDKFSYNMRRFRGGVIFGVVTLTLALVQKEINIILLAILGLLDFGGFYWWNVISYIRYLRGKGYRGNELVISFFLTHYLYEFIMKHKGKEDS